ncbi:hypothetical protein EUBSIR_01192 [[Eubacterium] siraeum DSM 15702]|uniref:Leucine-rich repeat domain-containing protein n=1 Tax=[Eubacterium] siraeum DSM 15702 TaxID=428128 RepID=B0MMY0_9FIRM|nr:hypothetical protein EUBSIR_01192 [[Eubacterium] siraeum DSM 15702]
MLKKLTIPDTVRAIEQHAFANCTSLEKVTLSENTLFHGEFFTVAKKYIFTHLRQAMK